MIKMIFFDFDGTISDAKKIAHDSFVWTLNDFGYDFDDRKLKELMGMKIEKMLKELGLKIDDTKKIRKGFYKYFTEAVKSGGIKPCVSLKPLWRLKENYDLVVVSNSEKNFLKTSIEKLGLKGLFSAVYGAEDFNRKDEMLKKLFRKFEVKADEAIYVGDRFSDVGFAREAGCVAVAIYNKSSWSNLAKIKKEKPDFIVRDFYGFRKVVEKLNDIK